MKRNIKYKMIDYSKSINEFSIERTIEKFLLLHPHISIDVDGFRQFLSDFKIDCCSPMIPLERRIENTKKYKTAFGNLMDSYCAKERENVKFSGIKFIDDMVDDYRCNHGDAELNSAIITILRIPNWPMLSDDELERLNKNKKPKDLGVLDTVSCPYNLDPEDEKEISLNLLESVDRFFDNVEDYIENNFKDQPEWLKGPNGKKTLFSKEELKAAIIKFRMMIDGKIPVPEKLKGIIEYYRKLRDSNLVKIFRKNKEGFSENSFMETESGCQMNSYRSLVSKINELTSVARISNTIGNYFCGDSKYVNNEMKKVIPILFEKSGLSIPMDCADFSYGKGDAYKTRIVYILWTVIQNILGPTAERWGKLQEEYGYRYIGTTHQHDLLNKEGLICSDAVGIDYTQYSDFLFKGVFFEILRILGFTEEEAKTICELVSLPIIYKGKMYPVKLASNMGVKMDFVLITEANLYMYVISSIILDQYSDEINVVGDDRWETVHNRCYEAKEIFTKLQVACSFNCKVNSEKTSWLKRDGIFGGCHVWYNVLNLPSTGIAPSQLLKDFYQINDYNALINKVIDSGQQEIYTQDIIMNLIQNPMSQELLLMGNRKFGYKDEDLSKFLNNAYNIPYQFGGLGYNIQELDPSFYSLPIFQNLLNILKQNCSSNFDNFIKVFHFEDNFITVSLNNRKGSKNFKDLRDLMVDLRKLNEPGLISNEFLQSIRKRIQKYLDLQRKLENQGRSASTKNRQSLRYDSDKLFRQEMQNTHITVFDYKDDLMSKQILLDFHKNKDKNLIAKLLSYSGFMSKIEGVIALYYGWGGEQYWGLRSNEFPGRWIRLETELNNLYPNSMVTKDELVDSPNYFDYMEIRRLLSQTKIYSIFRDLRQDFIKGEVKEFKKDSIRQWVKEEIFKEFTKRKG